MGDDSVKAPKLTVKSRTPGKVEIAREMRYPTNYQQPRFSGTPTQYDNNNILLLLPPTPSDFETKPIGVTLNVTPTTYTDRRIDLDFTSIQVTDFEGFVNYGSTVRIGDLNSSAVNILGSYVVDQPVFNVRDIKTKLQVIDGQTVIMGGLIREDRSQIDDKVPLLGDLPGVGRLFRSKVNQSVKRNLVIFVTAKLVRPTGKPRFLQRTEEVPFQATAAANTVAPVSAVH